MVVGAPDSFIEVLHGLDHLDMLYMDCYTQVYEIFLKPMLYEDFHPCFFSVL